MVKRTSIPWKPGLEPLENRCLLASAIGASVVGRTLFVNGTERADQIAIKSLSGGSIIEVSVANIRTGQLTQRQRFRASAISDITVHALSGDDVVRNETNLPSQLWGGAGNDRLVGGGSDDMLYGEDGSDELKGKDGADWLHGGAGRNVLRGGFGDDWLFGGADASMMYGDYGLDHLFSGDGVDYLDGGLDGWADELYSSASPIPDALVGTRREQRTIIEYDEFGDPHEVLIEELVPVVMYRSGVRVVDEPGFSGGPPP